MGLDIRLPIGLMFTLIGAILAVFGVLSDDAIYQRSLGHNVNLVWGIALLAFGVIFLYYGWRGTQALRDAPPAPSPDMHERPPVHRDH